MKKKTQIENYKSYCISTTKINQNNNTKLSEKITRGRQLNIIPKKLNEKKSKEKKRLNSNYNNLKKFQIRENQSNNSSFSSFSESSSISSNEFRKKNFLDEESFNYPNKNEVGLFSSDEESPEFEINFREELENQIGYLINDIYYRNYSKKINSINSNHYINKKKNKKDTKLKKREFEILKKELKFTFSKLNENYILILKILSKKIKECINHFKEELFDNPEFSIIKNNYIQKNEEFMKKTNKLFKEYCSLEMINEKKTKKNNSPINKKNNISEQIISDILIRDLERIKTCLINSSNEIKEIFQYPLNLLNKSFNIEHIQLEAFKKYILNDKLISTIFLQIKLLYNKNKLDSKIKLIQLIENDERYCKREMTKFDNYLDEKIKEENNLNSEEEIDNKSYYNSDSENEIKNHIRKNFLSLSSFSSIETKISPLNDEINENIINEEENKILSNDIDIDDLVKYIDNDEDVIKKKKKKKNKKKNKNSLNQNLQDDKKENEDNVNFENIFLKFKQDIINDTLDYYKTQKIKSNFSASFLMKLYTNGIRK